MLRSFPKSAALVALASCVALAPISAAYAADDTPAATESSTVVVPADTNEQPPATGTELTADTKVEQFTPFVCQMGTDVSHALKNTVITHAIQDFDFTRWIFADVTDDKPLSTYMLFTETAATTLDNSAGELRAGDFFEYRFDPGLRMAGALTPASWIPDDLHAEVDGQDILLAHAYYNPVTNTVTYVLTPEIEKHETQIPFVLTTQAVTNFEAVQFNGPRNMLDSLGYTEHAYTLNFNLAANVENKRNANYPFSFNNYIQGIDVPSGTYSQIFYFNPLGHTFNSPLTLTFQSLLGKFKKDPEYGSPGFDAENAGLTTVDGAQFFVYEVPDGVALSDSFGQDLSVLKDVTSMGKLSSVTYEDGNEEVAFVLPGPISKRYVFVLKNNYGYETITDENGNKLQVLSSFNTGLKVRLQYDGLNWDHASTSLLQQQAPIPVPIQKPANFCARDRIITVTKVDQADPTKKLKGAVFEVRRDKEVVDTLTTGEDGTATSKRLPLGTYTVVETKAPEGYVLDATEHTVKIEATANDSVEATINNVAVPPTPWVPLTPPPVTPQPPVPADPPVTPQPPAITPPQPEPQPQPEPKPAPKQSKLAKTGSDALTLIAVSAATLAAGGLVLSRRREDSI